jgi:hypothetical protein
VVAAAKSCLVKVFEDLIIGLFYQSLSFEIIQV